MADIQIKPYRRNGVLVSGYNRNILKRKKKENKRTASSNKIIPSIVAGAALVGMTTGAFVVARQRYRGNFAKNLETVKRLAKSEKSYKLPANKSHLSFTVGGFDGTGNKGIHLANKMKNSFPSHEFIPVDSAAFNIKRTPTDNGIPFMYKAIARNVKTILKNKGNPVSMELAAKMKVMHDKNPTIPIVITGHSAGGLVVREAAEYAKMLKIPNVKVISIGTPYLGLTKRVYPEIAIGSRSDGLTAKLPVKGLVNVKSTGHKIDDYFDQGEINNTLNSFINRKIKRQTSKSAQYSLHDSDLLELAQFANFKDTEKSKRRKRMLAGIVGASALVGGGILAKRKLKGSYKGLNISSRDRFRFTTSGKAPVSLRNQFLVKETQKSLMEPFTSTGYKIKKVLVEPFTRDGKKVGRHYRKVKTVVNNVQLAKTLKGFEKLDESNVASFNTTFRVVSPNGTKYIYKEAPKKAGMLQKSFGKVAGATEAFASDIAEGSGIKTQKTVLVPPGAERPFGDVNQAATMHEFVPGIPAIEAEAKGLIKKAGIALKPYTDRRSLTKHNPVEKFVTALNHKDTAKLNAFDIFIGNRDRHSNNYFYDATKDSFYGIDHGGSGIYKPDFFEIKKSIADSYKTLDDKQRKNLQVFKATLKDLTDKNSPQDIESKLDKYYSMASANSLDPITRATKEKNKRVITSNHKDARDLVDWLGKLGV